MTSAWPIPGPPARDELASWTDARLSDATLPLPPAMSAPPPPGRAEIIDGRGVYVRRSAGPAGATPVWYIHGLAGSSTNWSRISEMLAPLAPGFIVDLPGSGRSDPPPRGRYSITADADLLAGLIREVSATPVHIVGNSLGGVVSVALAARHPDLVRTLSLISPAVPDLRLGTDRGADPRLAVLLMPGTGSIARRRLSAIAPLDRAIGMGRLCFGDSAAITDHDYRMLAKDLDWRFGLPWAQTSTIGGLRALMRSYLQPGRWSFVAAARSIRVPTLVVWGTRDRLVDVRLARPTADLFADNRLLVVAGSGHVAMMEHPEVTARAIAALWDDAGRIAPAGPDGHAGAPLPGTQNAVATSTS